MPRLVDSLDAQTISVIRAEETPRSNRPIFFKTYGVAQLPELISALPSRHAILDEHYPNPQFTIRYVVTSTGQLLFGFEGLPGKDVPSHAHLGEKRCITAGNMTFSDNYQQMISIDNRSGDFRPSKDSVNYALAILIHHTDGSILSNPFTVCDELLTLPELTSRVKDTPVVRQQQSPPQILSPIKRKIDEDSKDPESVPPPKSLARHLLFSPKPQRIPSAAAPLPNTPVSTP